MGAGLWDWKGFKLGVLQFRVGVGPVGHWEGGWLTIYRFRLDKSKFIGHTEADGAEQSHKPISVGLTEAEELEKYITIREEVYKKAKEFDSNIISFETVIKRPYFHIYLDFIEREGDLSKNRRFAFLLLEQSGDILGAQAAYQLAHSELPPKIHHLFLVFPFIFDILGTITINVLTWVAAAFDNFVSGQGDLSLYMLLFFLRFLPHMNLPKY
ncbi:hypothetical protein DVH24_025307 [Malus domestica]|uniref:Uncharacterized protein n=1 Tax=Malus domestica TaxID=3750 RepID=A0A498HK04_MALDO|nr:hypothetical protein DVH24_025307 [Malus domestica]